MSSKSQGVWRCSSLSKILGLSPEPHLKMWSKNNTVKTTHKFCMECWMLKIGHDDSFTPEIGFDAKRPTGYSKLIRYYVFHFLVTGVEVVFVLSCQVSSERRSRGHPHSLEHIMLHFPCWLHIVVLVFRKWCFSVECQDRLEKGGIFHPLLHLLMFVFPCMCTSSALPFGLSHVPLYSLVKGAVLLEAVCRCNQKRIDCTIILLYCWFSGQQRSVIVCRTQSDL